MDLRKWAKFLFINIFLLMFVRGFAENICSPGIETQGYTVPRGDIIIEYGNPLNITCVLHQIEAEKLGPKASSYLMYKRNDDIIPPEMIEIINSSSIRLFIEKPPKVSSDVYTCMLNNTVKSSICMNLVTVGNKPLPVDDFECIGYNYENLTCMWTPPENYVSTSYNLTFRLMGRSRVFNNACPFIKYPTENEKHMSCFWNISTSPQYRQAHKIFYFNLTMTNIFGTNHINKTFYHFQHVLSGPPENLTFLSSTSSSIYLYWKVPTLMQPFPPGVHHRIIYQCQYGKKEWLFGGLITNSTGISEIKYNLTGLEYAHALYDIRVSIRSADALSDDESMWSKNSSLTEMTKSKIPDEPPKTTIGSFEIANDLPFREVYIYWQHLPAYKENGPDFGYNVAVEGNYSLQPTEINKSYALFKNLSTIKSYKFLVWSRNSEGQSVNNSFVYVPIQDERVKNPISFTKVEFGGGKYELSWEPPKIAQGQYITNYTIFWCNENRERPIQCNGKLDWTIVPTSKTVHNETLSENELYQFAISANTENSTSGMLWATCTVIHGKSMGKLKTVWINNVGSTYIDLRWNLDCTDRIVSVVGYAIYYCPITAPEKSECKVAQKNVTFPGDTSVVGKNVTGLTPYTTYMLSVSVITKHSTFSQQSDPVYNTTSEAAPGSPPSNVTVLDVTNSSITLTWLPPKIKNGILKCYIVQYNNESKKIDPETTIKLTNLSSYENYLISIKACTTSCSEPSKLLNVTTKMSYPSKITPQPTVIFQNDSFFTIHWSKPELPGGKLDFYEVRIKQKHQSENKTIPVVNVTERTYSIKNCGDENTYNTFYTSVRAVNIINGKFHHGPWSDELEFYCRQQIDYIIYLLIFVVVLLCVLMFYSFKRLYQHCKIMQDVEVKLPPGLAPVIADHTLMPWNIEKHQDNPNSNSPPDEELLLVKMNEGKLLSGDSSGCSSGHESVSSSLETATHMSNASDSGTEQPRSPSTDDTRTNSLRLRNVPISRPSSITGYTTMPTSSINPNSRQTKPTSNYCLYGVALGSASSTESDSSPVPPVTASMPDSNKVPYIPCDIASQTLPYVMTGEAIKSVNPTYVPFNSIDTPEKNTSYVVAGIKSMLVSDILNCDNMKQSLPAVADEKPLYKAADSSVLLGNNLKED